MNLEKVLSGFMFVYLSNSVIKTVILWTHGKWGFSPLYKDPEFEKYHVIHIQGAVSYNGCKGENAKKTLTPGPPLRFTDLGGLEYGALMNQGHFPQPACSAPPLAAPSV